MQKNIILIMIACLSFILYADVAPTWGFSFNSPQAGTTFNADSTVAVDLDFEGTGPLVGVLYTAYGAGGRIIGNDFEVLPPYAWILQLPPDYFGTVTINAMGKVLGQQTGTPPETEININVSLAASVVLKQMWVRDDQKIIYVKVGKSRQLRIYGGFSDFIERHIESAQSGTSYLSSDGNIATVTADGLVTAVGSGTATITVRNADKQLVLDVKVH